MRARQISNILIVIKQEDSKAYPLPTIVLLLPGLFPNGLGDFDDDERVGG